MTNLDIFIKSYHKDFKWLFFCLSSIDKFVDGFQKIIIAIPNNDKEFFTIDTKQFPRIHNSIEYVYTDDYGDTYLYQQYIKMIAYKYSNADLIMFVDSDIVFKEKTNICNSFLENKPIVYYAPYEHVGPAIRWKRPTSDFIGEEQKYEFMRQNCLIYFRNTLVEIHEKYPDLEKMIMDSKVGFSEFNAIGAWAFKNHGNKYQFINAQETERPPANHIQFWSPTNINEQDLKQIREILYGNMVITEENFAILERDTHIGKWVKDSKRLDFDQSALKTYLPFFKEGDVLLNIGANIGSYSYAFTNKASKIICFEPSIELFECLKYNLGKYVNVELYNEAISDTNEPYEVICLNNNVGMTHIKFSKNSSKITRTIDSYSFDKVDFILIDCEGYEPKILSGAQNTISKHKPILVIEINIYTLEEYGYNKNLIYDFLDQNNYKYRNIYENQDMEGDQFDIICFPCDTIIESK